MPRLPAVPVVEPVTFWNLPPDVEDEPFALPVPDERLLAQPAVHELFDELDAAVLEQLRIWLQPSIERHRELPRFGEHVWILDGHLVVDRVLRDGSEALRHMQRLTMIVAGPVEPVLAVELRYVSDQRIAFPPTDRMSHICQVRRWLHLVEVDRAAGARERERHVDLVRALDDLNGVGHVHRTRDARQVALQLRIAVDPILSVLVP